MLSLKDCAKKLSCRRNNYHGKQQHIPNVECSKCGKPVAALMVVAIMYNKYEGIIIYEM
jgi:hypothetical protein